MIINEPLLIDTRGRTLPPTLYRFCIHSRVWTTKFLIGLVISLNSERVIPRDDPVKGYLAQSSLDRKIYMSGYSGILSEEMNKAGRLR